MEYDQISRNQSVRPRVAPFTDSPLVLYNWRALSSSYVRMEMKADRNSIFESQFNGGESISSLIVPRFVS